MERGWPPRLGKEWRAERMADAVGARLDPIRITYRVGDETYVEDIPGEFTVCTSKKYEEPQSDGTGTVCDFAR